MDPIVSSVVTALVAGALASAKAVAGTAVVDAYSGLKKVLADTYSCVSVGLLESRPSSESFKQAAAEEIADRNAAEDEAVVELAAKLLNAIESDARAARALGDEGIDIGNISAGRNVLIERLHSRRVKIGDIDGGEDVILKDIGERTSGN